jgi:hypothetical protein
VKTRRISNIRHIGILRNYRPAAAEPSPKCDENQQDQQTPNAMPSREPEARRSGRPSLAVPCRRKKNSQLPLIPCMPCRKFTHPQLPCPFFRFHFSGKSSSREAVEANPHWDPKPLTRGSVADEPVARPRRREKQTAESMCE